MSKQSSLILEYSLINENIFIQRERISKLYIIQSKQSALLWFGVLFVDTGIYLGAVIRFHMIVDTRYPDSGCPRIFVSPIPYHPLIDPDTGELDTKNAFPNWNSRTHHIHHLLSFLKNVFYQPEIYISRIQEELINEDLFNCPEHTAECVDTFVRSRPEFDRLNNEFKQQCCRQLFDRSNLFEDENYLQFENWDPKIHEPVRQSVLNGKFALPTSLYAQYDKQSDSVSFVPGHHSG